MFANATPGTSLASRSARKVFGNARFPWSLELPSVPGRYPPYRLKILIRLNDEPRKQAIKNTIKAISTESVNTSCTSLIPKKP